MDSRDLARFVAEAGIAAEIIHLAEPTPTVAAAAAAIGKSAEYIGKSILFFVNDAPLLVISNGLHRLEYRRLADHLGVGRRRIKLADADQVLATTGYPVGTVPPFGHATRLPTIVEHHVTLLDEIYAGGGAINALMRVDTATLLRLTDAAVVPLTAERA